MATVYYEDYIADNTDKDDESQDEDFNPDHAPQADDASSSSDDDHAPAETTSRSTKRAAPLDADELDSGDEVTIQAARKKKSKKQKKGKKDHDDEDVLLSDGEGIRTRAQRRVEQVEKKPLAQTQGATVDVDALWAQMIAAPPKPAPSTAPCPSLDAATATDPRAPPPQLPTAQEQEEEEQIQIRKTYTFAGQDTTEEKLIPRAHLSKYTADGWITTTASPPKHPDASSHSPDGPKPRRPLRRPSRFEPNPSGFVRTLAPEHQLTYPRQPAALDTTPHSPRTAPSSKPKEKPIQKLNVVDKSRMDWTGFVHKEGIAEELDTHGKTKEAYLGRMEFLKQVEARREEERKKVRSVGLRTAVAGGGA